jgi:O-antigen/teichoic acid export membrane protein
VILLAGALLPIEAAGYLKVGETFIAPFMQVVVGLNLMMLPMVSKRIDTMSRSQKQRRIVRLSLATFCVALPYSAAMVLFGPWLIQVGFGSALMPAAPLLALYAAIPICDSLNNPANVFLSAEGRSDLKLIVNVVRATLTLAAGLPLIWAFDVTGAAWARVLAAAAGPIMSWGCLLWLWRRHTQRADDQT